MKYLGQDEMESEGSAPPADAAPEPAAAAPPRPAGSRGKGGRPKGERLSQTKRNMAKHRLCAFCGVTQSPAWRSGPDGSGTLCNACGTKYRAGRLIVVDGKLQYPPDKPPRVQRRSEVLEEGECGKCFAVGVRVTRKKPEDPWRCVACTPVRKPRAPKPKPGAGLLPGETTEVEAEGRVAAQAPDGGYPAGQEEVDWSLMGHVEMGHAEEAYVGGQYVEGGYVEAGHFEGEEGHYEEEAYEE
ncbi:hypothetical protein DFJ74DRAFT_664760 [Hyaloraphidium curvatum]|nr:hypothetical protein DFJ74DRAFT_664760 [Hyaloraphidium curvatum]